MEEELLEMSSAERKRLEIIRRTIEGEIKQKKASELLGLSTRQVRRICGSFRKDGDRAIIHKLRGCPSNRRMDQEFRIRVLDRYRRDYEGFGPTLAAEKLREDQGINVSAETLRNWLKENKIEYPARRARPHRHWRKRKGHRGEMIQLDGSHHDWLEGRGPWLVLMAYIDDATSEVLARFYESEDNFSVLDSFTRYVRKNGLPCSLYSDRHPSYKAGAKQTNIVEQLEGLDEPLSNFQRALKELDVDIIYAYSPQAKGRVERLFRTLQDRLVKEMRLRTISTIVEANLFLQTFLPRFNKKYRVPAENNVDLHRKLPSEIQLRQILCIKEIRILKNDFTVQYRGKVYQINDNIKARQISVETWLDSSLHFRYDGAELRYKEIHPPVRPAITEGPGKNHHLNRVQPPPKNSPWREFMINPSKR